MKYQKNALDQAIALIGSQAELAKRLKVSRAAVGQWRLPGRKVPTDHCPKIEEWTNGQVRCESLRPDVNWAYLRRTYKDCCPKADTHKLYPSRKKKTA